MCLFTYTRSDRGGKETERILYVATTARKRGAGEIETKFYNIFHKIVRYSGVRV